MAKVYTWFDKYRDYDGFSLYVDDYKENGYYQFRLDTPLHFINTNRDFKTPEHAFKYAEERMRVEFTKIVNKLKRGDYAKSAEDMLVHMDS